MYFMSCNIILVGALKEQSSATPRSRLVGLSATVRVRARAREWDFSRSFFLCLC